jgi:LysM repeat protein
MELEQIKQKYAAVWETSEQYKVRLDHVHIQDNKLFIQGVAPSEQASNKIWDQIKAANPNWGQEVTVDITVDPSAQPATGGNGGARTYTVQSGDSLSKISEQFYGSADKYMKIFEANRDIVSDPNKIKPGQTLSIPA